MNVAIAKNTLERPTLGETERGDAAGWFARHRTGFTAQGRKGRAGDDLGFLSRPCHGTPESE